MHISAHKKSKKKDRGVGSSRIARSLRMAALSLKRSQTYLGAFFRRTSGRKDYCIAITATARKLAEHLYRALRHGQKYVEQGVAAYEAKYREDRLKYAIKIAQSMGYTLMPQENPNEVSA